MTQRFKLEDGDGGAYAILELGPRLRPRTIRLRLDYLLGFGLILFLLFYFAALECIRPHFFLHDDNASFYIADFLQTYDTLEDTGRLAEVNFYQYGGEPVVEMGQSSVLYPPGYLCVALARLLGDARWAVDLIIVFHFIVGAVGLFVWLRLRQTDPVLAFLGACLWILSPFVLLVCSSGCAFAYTVAYLPWIFCALDQLVQKPGLRPAVFLALPLILMFLSGAAQIFAYVPLFVGLYVAGHLTFSLKKTCAVLTWLAFTSCCVVIFVLPLLLPLLHAVADSVQRSKPLYLGTALDQALELDEFVRTQLFMFGKESLPTSNSSLFLCPEFVLVPIALLGFQRYAQFVRARWFLVLALIALLLSTWVHLFLSLLALFNRFRWPFKVFIFWKFFLLMFIFSGLTAWLGKISVLRRIRRLIVVVCSAVVLAVTTAVVLIEQDAALFSHAQLPSLHSDLETVIDPLKGRALAVGQFTDDGRYLYRDLAYCYSTVFELPNIGGYNPLISRESSAFGLGLNLPDVYLRAITPALRADLNRKCVRYLLVNPKTLNGRAATRLDGMKVLLRDQDRIVLENLQADPMIISDSGQPYDMFTYRGNSLFVPLSGKAETIGISLNQNPNWRYRIDGGAWQRPVYFDDRLWSSVAASGHLLEVRYVDPTFRAGLRLSLFLSLVLAVTLLALRWQPVRRAS